MFSAGVQLRSTKVLCRNSEEGTLCYYKIGGLKVDVARKTTVHSVSRCDLIKKHVSQLKGT
jgi:hypothetical protein